MEAASLKILLRILSWKGGFDETRRAASNACLKRQGMQSKKVSSRSTCPARITPERRSRRYLLVPERQPALSPCLRTMRARYTRNKTSYWAMSV